MSLFPHLNCSIKSNQINNYKCQSGIYCLFMRHLLRPYDKTTNTLSNFIYVVYCKIVDTFFRKKKTTIV